MKARVLRLATYWLSMIFYVGGPLLALNYKYPIFKGVQKTSFWSIATIMACIWIAGWLLGAVKKYVADLPEGTMKAILITLKPPILIGCICVLLHISNIISTNIVWIVDVSLISIFVGYLFSAWHMTLLYKKHADERLEGKRS